jgi:endo-1,4-beta-xylanase
MTILPSVVSAQTTVLSGWGFTSDGGFRMTEPEAGSINMTAISPSASSGQSQIALRTLFDKIDLTPGDSLSVSGEFSISNSQEGGNTYMGWSYSHVGLFNSNGNAGTLADGVWSGSNNQGFTGYLLIMPTSASGSGSPWGSGPLGSAGALLAGNTANYYAQSGAMGLGGDFQQPETAGIGAGSYEFEITVTRIASYRTQFDYYVKSIGSDNYLLQDTVIDEGVNADGTPSTLSFDTVGFSTTSSNFTDWNISDVRLTLVRGDPSDPSSLYDFEKVESMQDWFATPAAQRVARATMAAGTINDTGALAVTMPNGFSNWGAQLSLASYSEIYQAIREAKLASVDLARYAIRFDVTLLTSNSGGYTGDLNVFAAIQSGANIKQWAGASDILTMTWDADKTASFTADLSTCTLDLNAATLNFYIGFQCDSASPFTVLIDNVRLVSLDPDTALREKVAAKYLRTTVYDDGHAYVAGLGWLWVSSYPTIFSYDLEAWRGSTSEYSFGWVWTSGDISTGAWFWDFFTEKWFYSDAQVWPWAYFYEDNEWAYLQDGHDAILSYYNQTPDSLLFDDGETVVTDLTTWEARREQIKTLFEEHIYGHMPPAPDSMEVIEETAWVDNAQYGVRNKTLTVSMTVGENTITTKMYVNIPLTATAEDPRPVILTHQDIYIFGSWVWDGSLGTRQPYFNQGWAGAGIEYTEFAPDSTAARTGKLYQLYGTDIDTGDLMAWAWCYSRLIDVLEMQAYPEIDLSKIAVTGHSRYGKCALVAGAFDERIALTAPSHSGTGGAGSFKNWFTGGEPISAAAGGAAYWFSPAIQAYIDDPQSMPVDTHMLTALVAPRGLVQIEGTLDPGTSPKATQLSNMAARRVYEALGVGNMLGLRFRPVGHVGNDADVLEFANYLWNGASLSEGFNLLPYPIAPVIPDEAE